MTRLQANLALLFIAMIWGSAFVAQAHGMDDLPPITFTGIRFLLGALIVAPLAWRDLRAIRQRALRPHRNDYLGVIGLGLLLTLGAVLQQTGLVTTSVTNTGFLTVLYVPLMPLVSWLLFGVRPHWLVWPCASGCLAGTWLLSGAGPVEFQPGDLWIISSSIFWGLHVLLVGGIAARFQAPFFVAAGQFLACAAACLAWAALTECPTLAGIERAALPILYTSVLSVSLAYTIQVIAQAHTQPVDAAIILSAETLFAALFGYLLMGDRLTPAGMLGCTLIFVCIVVVQLAPQATGRIATVQLGRAKLPRT